MYEIRYYLTSDGKDLYSSWLRKLRDIKARIAIDWRRVGNRRIRQIALDDTLQYL